MSDDSYRVFEELLNWSCYDTTSEQCRYLGNNIYAIKTVYGVGIVKAESYSEAYDEYLNEISKIAKEL
ncbi:MAG: hypothetical protein J5725_04380 [Bacteroidales bacterium]|nr:hypothetical protein [Bacteroidales bacterium]